MYECFVEIESLAGQANTNEFPASAAMSKKLEIHLIFLQDPTKTYNAQTNKKGEISWRIMQYSLKNINTLNKQTLVSVAQKIKEFFGEPMKGDEKSEFVWHKGQRIVTYCDWDMGYHLKILSRNNTDGVSVIERILEMNGHVYHPEYVNFTQNNEPSERFPSSPIAKTILGQSTPQPVQRPVIDVRLQRAYAIVPGMPKTITLYDVRGIYPDALVK